jgi:DNA-binding transcriptional regulator YiaG
MSKSAKPKTVAERLREGMGELEHAMRSGKPLHELFTVRTVQIPDPRRYDARAVKASRERLNVSQTVFAKLLGVSVELVENWEQGRGTPRAVVRRLLDEINRNPSDFLARHTTHIDRTLRKAG